MAITVARHRAKRNRNLATEERMAGQPGNMPRRALMVAALSGAATVALRTRPVKAAEIDQGAGAISGRAKGHPDVRHLHAVHSATGCKVVEGDVAITGWCNVFDLAD